VKSLSVELGVAREALEEAQHCIRVAEGELDETRRRELRSRARALLASVSVVAREGMEAMG
jgi:hypothetical protein